MAVVRTSYRLESEIDDGIVKLFRDRIAKLYAEAADPEIGQELAKLAIPNHLNIATIGAVIDAGYGNWSNQFIARSSLGGKTVTFALKTRIPAHLKYSSYQGFQVTPEMAAANPFAAKFLSKLSDVQKAEADMESVRLAIKKLLNSVPTLNKAIEAFPDLENYISKDTAARLREVKERAKPVKAVPAEIEGDVRATLIKAKILHDPGKRS